MSSKNNVFGNQNGIISAEYVWIGGNGELRSKIRTINGCFSNINNHKNYEFPDWNYDGSSTQQATGDDSEVIIRSVELLVSYIDRDTTCALLLQAVHDIGQTESGLSCLGS